MHRDGKDATAMPAQPRSPRSRLSALPALSVLSVAVALAAVTLTACKPLSSTLGDLSGANSPSGSEPAAATAPGLIAEPDQGYQPIYQLISSAKTSLDMTMYELVDTTAEQDLAADAQRGVAVRVILDQNLEKSSNQTAFSFLSGHGVKVVWADPSYSATHQKTITVDHTTAAIMTGNLTSRYYSTTRDFAVLDTNSADVAAIEQTFDADFTSASTTPPNGTDLVWSPTTAEPDMLAIINGASHSLIVENEEMSASPIVTALANAAGRGVDVQVVMTADSEWTKNFDKLAKAGVHIATYAANASLYIHAKVIVADAGESDAKALLGSENFSTASLTRNRELGLTITDPTMVAALHTTLTNDFTNAQPWSAN